MPPEATATIAVNVRLPEELHRQLTERKAAGGSSINTQVVWALRDYQDLAKRHEDAQRQIDALQAELATSQLGQAQALAQVDALMRLNAELTSQQLTQLAQTLTESHRVAMREAAQRTARAVSRELHRPVARRAAVRRRDSTPQRVRGRRGK